MSHKVFNGFPSGAEVTPLPNLFFTEVLPNLDGAGELKTVLYIFWLLSRRRGYPQFVTINELLTDAVFMSSLETAGVSKEQALRQALEKAVNQGVLLRAKVRNGSNEEVYLINNDISRDAIKKIEEGKLPDLSPAPSQGGIRRLPRDIYSLYEQNIGMLNPLIAEQLQDAEKKYPADWIEAAFKEATALNKRNWKYILRILERWAIEGKDNGKLGRDTEKDTGREKYIQGKYGHMVKG